jgi:hypothetical protein
MTIKWAATALGVATSTIHRLINDGIIAGEPIAPGAPWRIRLSDGLKARFNGEAGEGFLPMREAIRALGVSRQTVLSVSSAASSKPFTSRAAGKKDSASR